MIDLMQSIILAFPMKLKWLYKIMYSINVTLPS
jgi:hypothetical protein